MVKIVLIFQHFFSQMVSNRRGEKVFPQMTLYIRTLKIALIYFSETLLDLPDTRVDLPDTMVDLPDTKIDLPDTMVDLFIPCLTFLTPW